MLPLPSFGRYFLCLFLTVGALPHAAFGEESSQNWGLRAQLKGNSLELQLKGPLDALVDFNRRPTNQRETKALEGAIQSLKSLNSLFQFSPGARCTLSVKGLSTDVKERHIQESPDKPAQIQKKGSAGVVHATYGGVCEKPAQLKKISVHLFKLFPRVNKLAYEADRNGKLSKRVLNKQEGTVHLPF